MNFTSFTNRMTAVIFLGCLLNFTKASAQKINSNQFLNDMLTLVQEAQKGFPTASGETIEDSRYEKQFSSKISFFGLTENVGLQYIYPQENQYSPSTPESYFFRQAFLSDNPANKFMNDSAEILLDEIAASSKLKKEKIKQKSRGVVVYQYQTNGKPVFSIATFKDNKQVTIKIYSPLRPGEVQIDNLLGAMAFYANNTNFMYIVPVYGSTLADKAKMVSDVYRKLGYSEYSYTYQWFPGRSANSLDREFGKQKYVKLMNGFYID